MTVDEMRALGPRLAELCQKYGIAELSVFGSIVRGTERPDSDVDLLYARLPGNDLGMSYFALQEDLEGCTFLTDVNVSQFDLKHVVLGESRLSVV